jgi:signal transduction histidine kinase
MDAEHRFTVGSDEFVALMGQRTAAALGRPWPELAATLALDPEGQIGLALATRETWNALSIAWPVDDGREHLTVELSGLPVFDRERVFRGYRGFGICRDVARLIPSSEARAGAAGAGAAEAVAATPGSKNVVPLRPSGPPAAPALSPFERNAFHELSRKLQERLTETRAPIPSPAAERSGAIELGAAQPGEALAQADIRELESKLAAATPERAVLAKSELLAEIGHAIRAPLNTIIGLSALMRHEVMRQELAHREKLGSHDERHRQYLQDIQSAGEHLMAHLDDLIDLSKMEAGRLDLDFTGVALNSLTQQCVASLQPQANRDRIIIRISLSPRLPAVIADARALRRMVLNLVSHSVKLAGAGGQVIVSTALTDLGEVVLRVRDNHTGGVAPGRKPFRQVAAAARPDPTGGGLGLPLTRALAQVNRAGLRIKSAPQAGTLIEVAFPPDRVVGGGS